MPKSIEERKQCHRALTKAYAESLAGTTCKHNAFKQNKVPEWLSEHSTLITSQLRTLTTKVVTSPIFEFFMAVVIIVNAVLIIFETDRVAQCYPNYSNNIKQCPYMSGTGSWLKHMNTGLLCLYSVEYLLRTYALRKSFLVGYWGLLDGVVILFGWVAVIFENMINLAFLRLIRIVRLTRAIRVLRNIRELVILINGFMNSVRAIFFGSVLIFIMLMVFGILMVEMVHPTNSGMSWDGCRECKDAFRTVGHSTMTLYKELVTGGTWISSFTMMDKSPAASLLIILTTSTITLGILNLILTVIVDQAASSRDQSLEEATRRKVVSHHEAKEGLLKCFAQIDNGASGKIRLQDVLQAREVSKEFQKCMAEMDLTAPELKAIFEIADREGAGELAYDSFCDELFHMKSRDQHMLLTMVRLSLQETQHLLEECISPKIEKLVKQNDMYSIQIALLGRKLDEFVGRDQGLLTSQADEANVSLTQNMYCHAGGYPPTAAHQTSTQIPGVDEATCQKCTHASALQNADTQAWKDLEQLQQEVQILLDLEAFLVKKAASQVDLSLTNVANSFQKMMSDAPPRNTKNIKTLEVWLAERKLQECASVFVGCSPSLDQPNKEFHEGQRAEDRKKLAFTQQQILSQLRDHLPQLLQLSRATVPKALSGSAHRAKNHRSSGNIWI